MRSGNILTAAVALAAAVSAIPASAVAGGWHRDLPSALESARAGDRPVLMHFSASWCGPCRQMEPVLRSAEVADVLRDGAVGVHLDFDTHKDVAQRYGVRSIPADVLLTPDGRVLGQMSGVKQPGDYARRVRAVAAQYAGLKVRAPAPRRPAGGSNGDGPVPRIARMAPPDRRPGAGDPSWEDDPALAAPDPGGAPDFGRSPELGRPTRDLGGAFGDSVPRPADDPLSGRPDPFGPSPAAKPDPLRTAPAQREPKYPRPDAPALAPLADDLRADDPAPRSGRPRIARRPSRRLLGMRGFCPVTLHEQRRWVRGDREFQWEHQGITYFLADTAAFDRFYEEPERYAPKLLGCDPVLYRDEGRAVPGSTAHAAIWRDDLFLFTSAKTRAAFRADPSKYANSRQVLLIEEIEGAGTF